MLMPSRIAHRPEPRCCLDNIRRRIHNDVYVVGHLNRNGKGGISKKEAKFIGPQQSEDVATKAITIAEALKKNGYATAHIGKYHAGVPRKLVPARS